MCRNQKIQVHFTLHTTLQAGFAQRPYKEERPDEFRKETLVRGGLSGYRRLSVYRIPQELRPVDSATVGSLSLSTAMQQAPHQPQD